MDKKLQITQATLRDLSYLRKLEEISFPIDRWPLLDLIGVLTIPGVIRLKAEIDGEFAGFIAGDEHRKKAEGWITTVAVFPEYRKMGIANQLLFECESLMRVSTIKLTVRKSNTAALLLYKKNGYMQSDTWEKYYIDGEDGIVLQKTVDFK